MAVIEAEIPNTKELRSAPKGPVTAARHRRNVWVYGLLCVLAFLPWLMGASWSWRAMGMGLMLPGGGFAVLGGWWLLLLPVTLFLFYVSFIAWFWAGMAVAPLAVWLGAALLARGLAGNDGMASAVWLVPLLAAGIYIYFWQKDDTRRVADRARHADRQKFFSGSLHEVIANAAAEPASGERELSQEQLYVVRHLLDRALQPLEEFKGFTIIDQFQPAALRYQLNHLGYALGMVQGHYTPNFSGYLGQAQRNLIEKYLLKRVWDYWVLESMWGHFNFTNFDPAAKDNIMLTGYFGMQVNQYMLNSGDRRYAEPGSLTFRLNERVAYPHDAHSLVDSVRENHTHSDFCLFPCEPNWVYPVCNMYGMSALASHDRVFGTNYTANVLPRWMEMLNTEFTDGKGSIIGLRSYWTGLEIPFYAGEAGFAFFANIFSPSLGQRLWAIGRKELSFCLAPDGEGGTRLSIPTEALSFLETIDPGHYRKGMLFAYAAVAMSAREFGDVELADAALRSMDLDCGRTVENGALNYAQGSGLANIWAMEAKLMQTGDFRNSFVRGPSQQTLQGPLLESAAYPAVLVAKAYSNGEDLNLVLHPGDADTNPQRLQFARLVPGKRYSDANNSALTCVADAEGKATIDVTLSARTVLHLVPALATS